MLNMDFSARVVIDTVSMEWMQSPSNGVQRKPLAREDRESGHATSIVRYLPGAAFSRHQHPMGEEIMVLKGVFSDQSGDYGAGTYFRNPPGSSHAPHSEEGCVLFVKLCQFQPGDRQKICVATNGAKRLQGRLGMRVLLLHQFGFEHTAIVRWPQATAVEPQLYFGGAEFLVISGCLSDEYGSYPVGSWLRWPHLSAGRPAVAAETVVWIKTGHLLSDAT